MIGQKQAIQAIMENKAITSILVVVGKAPDWFDPTQQDAMEIPMVYTELKKPRPMDGIFAKDQLVQLIHGNGADDKLFASWYANIHNAKPKALVALDGEGEIYVG